jgi:hypothetical protein
MSLAVPMFRVAYLAQKYRKAVREDKLPRE